MLETFSPPRWLRNAHVQSVLPSLKWRRFLLMRRTRGLRAAVRDYVLDCGDGVRLMGWYSPQPSGKQRHLAVLLHGWEGSSESLYQWSLASYLYDHGFDVFRLNFRDHGPTHHLNKDIFHSCRIAEVVGAVQTIQKQFAPGKMSLAGFSLGGNFALRVAARAQQAGLNLHRVVAISPVLCPKHTLDALRRGWFVYQQYFIQKWKRSLRIKQQHFPDLYDFAEILQLGDLGEMTDVLVRRHSEYPDMETYLDGYSIIGNVLAELQVPSHVLLAADDPIIPASDAQFLAKSPYLHVNVVPHGGHCGFFDNFTRESWADRTVAKLLEA